MLNPLTALQTLKRPQLLIRAARHGITDYDRSRGLPRLLGREDASDSRVAIAALIEAEDAVEADRKEGAATYSVARHIELLVAIMVEARYLGPVEQV